MSTFSLEDSKPVSLQNSWINYGGVPAKKTKKKRVVKSKKMKVGMPKKTKKANENVIESTSEYAMDLQKSNSELYGIPVEVSNQNNMKLQRSTSEPRGPPPMFYAPTELLSFTPEKQYDKSKPSEITIYIAGHGEEVFPREGQPNPFSPVLLQLIDSKKMKVRMVNKVNAPLVEGLAMLTINDKTILKTENEFYYEALKAFELNPKMDTKKIMKNLGKEYIQKYRDYLKNIAEKDVEHYDLVQLKKEILKKSTYLDVYHPTHEKYFTIRPMHAADPVYKDDSMVIRYGMYVVDIRNSPHGNIFYPNLNLTPMHEEYNANMSIYSDIISYLKLLFCSYDSPSELSQYRQNLCNAISGIIVPDNKVVNMSLSDVLILFYSLGFTRINIIDSSCRVDCGSNTGVCSIYAVNNTSECKYNIKNSLLEIAKLKKALVISPYSESSPESGNKKKVTKKKTKVKKIFTANIDKKLTRKV